MPRLYVYWLLPLAICLSVILGSPVIARTEPQNQSGTPVSKIPYEIRLLLLKGDFASIETMAKLARLTNAHSSNGDPVIADFYRSFGATSSDNYHVMFDQIALWQKKLPGSATAHLAAARLWNDYAWYARKSNTEDAKTLFLERNKEAARELAKVDPSLDDPFRYSMLFKVSRDLEKGEPLLKKIFDEQVTKYPSYLPAYMNRLSTVGLEYGGSLQSQIDFANQMLQKPGGATGRRVYLAIATELLDYHPNETLIGSDKLQWEPLRQSYVELGKVSSIGDMRYAGRFAYDAGDKPFAKAAMVATGQTYDESTWGTQERFDTALKWMNEP